MTILLQGLTTSGERIYHLYCDKKQLREALAKNSISVLKIKTIRTKRNLNDSFWLSFFLALNDNIIAYKSIIDALSYLSSHATKPLARAIFAELKQHILAGKSLSSGLKMINLPMASYHLALIMQSENNQRLLDALATIVGDIQQQIHYKKQRWKKLAYPCVLLLSAWAFLHFMLWVLLPNIQLLYESIGKSTTGLNHLIHWQTILLSVDLTLVVTILSQRIPIVKRNKTRLQRLLSRIPLIRHWLLLTHRLRWLRLFTLQYTASTPLHCALEQAYLHCTYLPLREACAGLTTAVKEGKSPSQWMQLHPFFPTPWATAFELGEKDNQLAKHCQHLLNTERESLLSKKDSILASLEPIILIVLAGLILLLILALYKPLLGLYGNYT